jgi:hypothetical protein
MKMNPKKRAASWHQISNFQLLKRRKKAERKNTAILTEISVSKKWICIKNANEYKNLQILPCLAQKKIQKNTASISWHMPALKCWGKVMRRLPRFGGCSGGPAMPGQQQQRLKMCGAYRDTPITCAEAKME